MQIVKSVDNAYAKIGDILTYTLVVTNDDGVVDNNVIVYDTLAPELSFVPGSVWMGIQVLPTANIITGIQVGKMQIGEIKTITFKAEVIANNAVPITNTAQATYQYMEEDGMITQASASSNAVSITIVNPHIQIFKEANRNFMLPEEELTYTVTLTNDGTLEAQNVIFRDDLPEQVILVQGSFKLNGVVVNQVEINKGINVGNLAIGGVITIKYTVKLVDADCKGWMNNQVYIKYNYVLPNEIIGEVVTTADEIGSSVQTRIAQLVIGKTPEAVAASVGDIIEYTLNVTNLGEEVLNNVVISDRLDSDLEFVPGSVTIESQPVTNANIVTGITLASISPNGTQEIKFKVKVLSNQHTPIFNIAEGIYLHTKADGKIEKTCSESNTVSIDVSNPHLKVIKSADVDFALLGDVITYTVTITNDGDLDAYNVVLKDELPKEVTIVPGCFSIDGVIVNEVELDKGINIGDIPVKGEMVVSYQVIVTSTNCRGWMENKAYVTFNYELVDGSLGDMTTAGQEANESVTIMLAISNFKQMSIESYLGIPIEKPNVETINSMTGTIDILNAHVIKTPQIISTEGQKLTGHKLIVRGMLQLSAEYTALEEKQSVHSAQYGIPFSTFIILPPDYSVGSRIEVDGIVEDIYYKSLDIRSFFVNTTALINVRIVGC